mmetsp:Transcript_94918/g.138624  ORF Transcript_94918/g.138624 Transcript_94918/m.138624 type:complete len:267 (-) Transcript_94918:1318-2118(-)
MQRRRQLPHTHLGSFTHRPCKPCKNLRQDKTTAATDHLLGKIGDVGLIRSELLAKLLRLGLHIRVDVLGLGLQREGNAVEYGSCLSRPFYVPARHALELVDQVLALSPIATERKSHVLHIHRQHLNQSIAISRFAFFVEAECFLARDITIETTLVSFCHLGHEPVFNGAIQHKSIAVSTLHFNQVLELTAHFETLCRNPPFVPVVLDFREHGVNVGIKTVLGFEDHEIKICTSMHLHKSPAKVFDIANKLRQMHRGSSHARQPRVC